MEGGLALDLTRDFAGDDTEPAFSPDGERIAFRSEREGGGIFVMGASGESVRRLSDFGYAPSWSPDAKELVVSTVTFENPLNRRGRGRLLGRPSPGAGRARRPPEKHSNKRPLTLPQRKHCPCANTDTKQNADLRIDER